MEEQFISDGTLTQYALDLTQGKLKLIAGELFAGVMTHGYNAGGQRMLFRFLRLDLTPDEKMAIKVAFQPALQRLKSVLSAKGLTEYTEPEGLI